MKLATFENGQPEIFQAIQGEGASVGRNTIFVRLAQCNLSCTFCDSAFTWMKEDSKHERDVYDPKNVVTSIKPEDVAAKILEVSNGEIFHVTFTGGEPTLQQKSLISVCNALVHANPDFEFEIETNGSIEIKNELLDFLEQINFSPKLSSSGNLKNKRAYANIGIQNYINTCYKFVIRKDNAEDDFAEIEKFCVDYKISPKLVYMMPEGIDAGEITEGIRTLADYARENGYNVSPRLHVMVFGDKRGY